MSYEAEAQIVRELGKFLLDGSLYQGFKPVFGLQLKKQLLLMQKLNIWITHQIQFMLL